MAAAGSERGSLGRLSWRPRFCLCSGSISFLPAAEPLVGLRNRRLCFVRRVGVAAVRRRSHDVQKPKLLLARRTAKRHRDARHGRARNAAAARLPNNRTFPNSPEAAPLMSVGDLARHTNFAALEAPLAISKRDKDRGMLFGLRSMISALFFMPSLGGTSSTSIC
jgi:hypothetical protein